jgi:hypothetical protein
MEKKIFPTSRFRCSAVTDQSDQNDQFRESGSRGLSIHLLLNWNHTHSTEVVDRIHRIYRILHEPHESNPV